MKKCVRCQVDFEDNGRTHCIYCDCGLIYASAVDALFSDEKKVFKEQVVAQGRADSLERTEYLMGSYFRARSFFFMYRFNRQEYKIGKRFNRLLIEPLRYISILKIPWVALNFLDTVLFRMFYTGFCPVCQCKKMIVLRQDIHSKEQCQYNKEYTAIVDQIRTGEIALNEMAFRIQGVDKKREGKRSAYFELCAKRGASERILDVGVIFLSIILILYGLMQLVMPTLNELYGF